MSASDEFSLHRCNAYSLRRCEEMGIQPETEPTPLISPMAPAHAPAAVVAPPADVSPSPQGKVRFRSDHRLQRTLTIYVPTTSPNRASTPVPNAPYVRRTPKARASTFDFDTPSECSRCGVFTPISEAEREERTAVEEWFELEGKQQKLLAEIGDLNPAKNKKAFIDWCGLYFSPEKRGEAWERWASLLWRDVLLETTDVSAAVNEMEE